jgi:hypothetical protein
LDVLSVVSRIGGRFHMSRQLGGKVVMCTTLGR